ncbi:MAG: methyltransferase domain-containing protein, partial [Thiolinea sp.]
MMADPYQLDPAKIRSGFERAVDSYDTYAFLQREVGRRLLERLELIRLQPDRVVDLGCSTGKTTEALLHKYPKAHVTGLDLALSMVHKTRRTGRWWRRPSGICADAGRLPFKAGSIDMAVSNLMLQWCSDLPVVFTQLAQTLRPEGLLLFSTLGPDTLQELRFAWGQVDSYSHTSRFIDMHDVGDALLQA